MQVKLLKMCVYIYTFPQERNLEKYRLEPIFVFPFVSSSIYESYLAAEKMGYMCTKTNPHKGKKGEISKLEKIKVERREIKQ